MKGLLDRLLRRRLRARAAVPGDGPATDEEASRARSEHLLNAFPKCC